ncbi:cytidylyltransferase domain-containing protein [Azospirillum sp.]|uniref:cytidylyltransferase domain-containing protein n=1 Tax=Azospirillum sp. TaxID=34012 RepID=UPI003D7381C1
MPRQIITAAKPRQIVIVQARMASTRLPGKILQPLGGTTALGQVLRRCAAIPGIDGVCCAIPDTPGHEPIAAEARRHGASVHAGPEDDVLARYHGAAVRERADMVLRVTSDCPLIDPQVCGAVLALRRDAGADFAANNTPPSWPHGLDCEAMTMEALDRAAAAAARPGPEREHVTPWIRTAPGLTRVDLAGPGGALVGERWTLDYPEDLDFLRALFAVLPREDAGWREIVATLDAHPEIRAINAARRDPARIPKA